MFLFQVLLLYLVASVRAQSPLPEEYVQQSSYQRHLRQADLDYSQNGWNDYGSGGQQSSSACCGASQPQPCCALPRPQETCCLVTPPCCRPKPCCPNSNFWPFPVSPRWPQRSFYLLRRPLQQSSIWYPPPQAKPCCPWRRQPCCASPPCCPIRQCCEQDIPYCRRACPACPCRQALRRRAKRTLGCVTCLADDSYQRTKRHFDQECIPCRFGQPLVSHREKRTSGNNQCDSTCRGSPVDPYNLSRFKRNFAPDCDPCEPSYNPYTATREKRNADQCVLCHQSPFSAATMLHRTKRTFGDQCVACVNPLLHERRRKRTLNSGCRPCESPFNDGEFKVSRTKRQSRVCPCTGSAAFVQRIKKSAEDGCDSTCTA